MKALLEKCKATFNLQVQIPALNLRLSGPDFFNHFKEYCQSEEWKYFLDKKVQPLSDQYFSGYLANIPTGKNYSFPLKVSKSQKPFFLYLSKFCPNFMGQNFVKYFVHFLDNEASRKNAFEIY